jgi:hypothetical protein
MHGRVVCFVLSVLFLHCLSTHGLPFRGRNRERNVFASTFELSLKIFDENLKLYKKAAAVLMMAIRLHSRSFANAEKQTQVGGGKRL